MGKISYFHMEKQAAKEFPNEKVFGIFIFGQPQFIINDIELAKRVMIKDFEHFSGLRDFDQNSKVSKLFMSSLDGDDWKRMRSMMSGVFTTGKLKLMATHIAKVGENFEDHIEGRDIYLVKHGPTSAVLGENAGMRIRFLINS